ncbi:MAG: dicarboxylate/amino acid:cation symporter [Alphaproteobacteria bacterium]|nr:dicarboxylate/amino acid:cation symporter [Alphaproteobacteria bacterium]
MLKKLPVQLLICLIGGLIFGNYLSADVISFFYTISCFLKDVLMIILPIIIFGYLFAAILSFEKQAPLLILTIVVLVICSNAATVLTAYGFGKIVLPLLSYESLHTLAATHEEIRALWRLPFSSPVTPDKTMIFGVCVGLIASFLNKPILKQLAFSLRDKATIALKKGFIPFLPLYVLGFILKLDRDGSLGLLLQNYSRIFVISCVLITTYISLMYAIAANFRWRKFKAFVGEMLPAGLTGFSTMSSAAAIPVTLDATETNLNNREYADFVVPATVNIHMIGDGLNIALTSLALLLMTGHPIPEFSVFLTFTLYYCIAKFSAAGIPGGGVIVILPVAQHYLGLSAEATTMLATIYILQDPIITAANVMGNGAFALLTGKLLKKAKNE